MNNTDYLQLARKIAKFLDGQFEILEFKFGIDPLIGLVPGLGDTLSLIFSLTLVWIGYRMKLPPIALLRMLRNVALDYVAGVIPLVGDLTDLVYKSNLANLKILEQYHEKIIDGEIIS